MSKNLFKKWLFSAIVFYGLCLQAFATTYYVNSASSDDTGNGTTTATTGANKAKKTISGALAIVSAGDTITIASGTYAESTSSQGCLWCGTSGVACAFASDVTLQSASGNPADVIITNASSGAYDTTYVAVFRQSASHIYLKNLTFQSQTGYATTYVFECEDTSYITLNNCTINGITGNTYLIGLFPTGSGISCNNISILNCTLGQTGTSTIYGISGDPTSTATLHDITLKNNNVRTYATACSLGDATNVLADGGSYIAFGAGSGKGFILGMDSATTNTSGGTVQNIVAMSAASHAFLLGHGATTATVKNNYIVGGDHALVMKNESTGTGNSGVYGNVVWGGSLSALYLKGSQGCDVNNNTFVQRQNFLPTGYGIAFEMAVDDTASNRTVTNARVRHNTFIMQGNACVYGAVSGFVTPIDVNDNRYLLNGTGDFGYIGTTTNLKTLAAVRTAWNTVSSNFAANDGISDTKAFLNFGGGPVIGGVTRGIPPSPFLDLSQDHSPTLGGNLGLGNYSVGDAIAADLTKLHAITLSATQINAANVTPTTVNGDVGTAIWSMPAQGAGYKGFMCELTGFTNTSGGPTVITFPTAFLVTPSMSGDSAATTVSAATTTTLKITGATTVSGWIFVEGY
jgi:hypothetical protein